jgi:hypothetical protein
MKERGGLKLWISLTILLTILLSRPSYAQYSGGTGDGYSSASFCGSDLNSGVSAGLTIGSITGQSTFCSQSADVYSVTLTTGTAESFNWTLPTGSTILYTINTPTTSIISVNFGIVSGNIGVTAMNSCFSASTSLAVASVVCGQFTGGTDDGFSQASFCGTDLTGGSAPAIALSSIIGSTSFCSFGSDVFSVTITSGVANSFVWNLPAGASVIYSISTPTSSIVSISFGAASGTISVTATNSCSSVTSSGLAVTNLACNNYLGGADDGFTNATFCGSNLTGGTLGVISLSALTGGASICFNNAQNYSVSVLSGVATSFAWSTPTGGAVVASQNTPSGSIASIGFGVTNGNVQVTASNGCSTTSATLAVTGTNCDLSLGGSDDGFGNAIFCGIDLTGGALGPITLSAISGGASTYCFDLGQNYSVTALSGLVTSYVWTISSGGGVTSGTQSTTTTSLASISFPGANGTIQLDASNGCFSDSKTLAVTGTNCGVTLGSTDDGYNSAFFCSTDLNGGVQSPVSLSAISGGNYCINLGQPYTVNAVSGNPSSFLWTVTSGTGTNNQILSNFNSSVTNFSFTSGTATLQVEASNLCTSDSRTIILTGINCNTTIGGNDDGFTTGIFCSSSLNGGVVAPIALSAISGDASFCTNFGQNYSVTVTTGTANFYSWAGPPGAGAFAQRDAFTTSTASINFLSANGNVSVTASNGCSSAIATLAVTGVNCNTTIGGSNDGYNSLSFCGSNLTGGVVAAVTLGPISGPATFCFDLGANYSVATTAGTATSFLWTLPSGATQSAFANTFTSSLSTITFGGASGNITITASNACFSDTRVLAVSGTNCLVAQGGIADGFATAQVLNTPLPVTLLSFSAKEIDKGVELNWVTETEIDNDYFELERSKDGKLFSSIGKIPGGGNSKIRLSYLYLDKQPYRGTAYYRLKQVDFDGHFDYSETISVEFTGIADDFGVLIYPNPTANAANFNIRFNTSWEGADVTMIINDVTGRPVMKKTFVCVNPTQIKPGEELLKPGVYIVIIQVADRKLINRLVVQ